MKKSMFLMATAAMFILAGTASCEKPGGENGGGEEKITLDVAPKIVNFDAAQAAPVTLTVTTNATSWSIGEAAEWYTAVKEGTDKIVITATDNYGGAREHTLAISAEGAESVNVNILQAATPTPETLKGSQYVLVVLDDISYEYVKDKVLYDLRVDDTRNFFYWWNGLANATTQGASFYGYSEGWMAVARAGADWAMGAHFAGPLRGEEDWLDENGNQIMDGNGNPYKVVVEPADYDYSILEGSDWRLHMALKGSPDGQYKIFFYFGQDLAGGQEGSITVGAGTEYPLSLSDWTEIDIPTSVLVDAGWKGSTYQQRLANEPYAGGATNTIAVGFESSPAGSQLEWDATFFYKK